VTRTKTVYRRQALAQQNKKELFNAVVKQSQNKSLTQTSENFNNTKHPQLF